MRLGSGVALSVRTTQARALIVLLANIFIQSDKAVTCVSHVAAVGGRRRLVHRTSLLASHAVAGGTGQIVVCRLTGACHVMLVVGRRLLVDRAVACVSRVWLGSTTSHQVLAMSVAACHVMLVSGRRVLVRSIVLHVSVVWPGSTIRLLVCRLTGACHVMLVVGRRLLVDRTVACVLVASLVDSRCQLAKAYRLVCRAYRVDGARWLVRSTLHSVSDVLSGSFCEWLGKAQTHVSTVILASTNLLLGGPRASTVAQACTRVPVV